MKYKTIIEYDLNEDRSIKTWCISYDNIQAKSENNYADSLIAAAIILWGCKVLKNGKEIYEIKKRKDLMQFNEHALNVVFQSINTQYIPDLEEKEWKNIRSHQELNIED